MRILVTGATGFLGSYLVRDLIEQGHDVIVLIRPGADRTRVADILDRLCIVEGSLDRIDLLGAPLAEARPDAVAHLAWRGVGNLDRNSPVQARNIPFCVELAGLAAEVGATVFVGAGSQAEYGPYDRPITEDDQERPTTLYGHAKLAAGRMAARLCADRSLRFAWLRVFSTYGSGDAGHWLIPSAICTLREGKRMSLTGCEQRWGFLHARDAAAAFRTVLVDPAAEGVFNVGSPDAPPLKETLGLLHKLMNGSGELGFGDIPYRPDQVMVLQADIRRLSGLGWRPSVPLDEGLRAMVTSDAARPE